MQPNPHTAPTLQQTRPPSGMDEGLRSELSKQGVFTTTLEELYNWGRKNSIWPLQFGLACEFQEREIYDLFGIVFDGHPDLRRILMWDEFKDHPMRRDYVAPDVSNTNRRRMTRCWSAPRSIICGRCHRE